MHALTALAAGGAIAFGHPLGCTGARQVSTLLYELKRTGKKVGVSSMCVGTGEHLQHPFRAVNMLTGLRYGHGRGVGRGIAEQSSPPSGSPTDFLGVVAMETYLAFCWSCIGNARYGSFAQSTSDRHQDQRHYFPVPVVMQQELQFFRTCSPHRASCSACPARRLHLSGRIVQVRRHSMPEFCAYMGSRSRGLSCSAASQVEQSLIDVQHGQQLAIPCPWPFVTAS